MTDDMPSFGLIGNPISHSASPALFKKAYGGAWRYDLIETASFEEAVSRFESGDYLAVNVTAPFKEKAFLYASEASAEAKAAGAANILLKMPGGGVKALNSDVGAVVRMLEEPGTSAEGKKALIAGAGGAGRAAAVAAESLGMKSAICNRSLFKGVGPLDDLPLLSADADVIIWALPRFEGAEKLAEKVLQTRKRGSLIIEANYLDPVFPSGTPGYIGGMRWLEYQAEDGFMLMTGKNCKIISNLHAI